MGAVLFCEFIDAIPMQGVRHKCVAINMFTSNMFPDLQNPSTECYEFIEGHYAWSFHTIEDFYSDNSYLLITSCLSQHLSAQINFLILSI